METFELVDPSSIAWLKPDQRHEDAEAQTCALLKVSNVRAALAVHISESDQTARGSVLTITQYATDAWGNRYMREQKSINVGHVNVLQIVPLNLITFRTDIEVAVIGSATYSASIEVTAA